MAKGATKEKATKIKKSINYDVNDGTIKRKTKFCPKCGPGVFMASHKDRYTCGACGFTERK
ncbi:MAG: 30S ribosomal protein S27ae [Candidatus ainarchaeum sp.]|nr:30S ribosomal protein S27ae [Candidatus ainarchaeum sp.]